MRALAIVYQRDAGAGVFEDAISARGFELDTWMRADQDAPPSDPGAYDAVFSFGGAMHADQESHGLPANATTGTAISSNSNGLAS